MTPGAGTEDESLRRALAAACLVAGQFEKAEGLYRELLKTQPGEEIYDGLIKLYRRTERWADLIKILGDAAVDRDSIDLLDDSLKQIAQDKKTAQQLFDTARGEYQADADRLDYGDRMALALLAVEAKTGKIKWERIEKGQGHNRQGHKRGHWCVSPAYADGRVFSMGTAGLLYAYDAASGREMWTARYDGPEWADAATAIAVHPDGWTVFVTGMSVGVGSDYDYFTIAYSLDFDAM